MQISKHFSRSEFTCYCGCGNNTVDVELITVLEGIKKRFNRPVYITVKGGFRCSDANYLAGGSDNSQHMQGKAADIRVDSVSPTVVLIYLLKKYPNKYGIGSYTTFTHIDVRAKKARW